MIKQIPSKEIKDYLKNNSKCVLLDVRTQEEQDQFGRPDGEKLGLKTYFLTIQDENFVNDFKAFLNLNSEVLKYLIIKLDGKPIPKEEIKESKEKENK